MVTDFYHVHMNASNITAELPSLVDVQGLPSYVHVYFAQCHQPQSYNEFLKTSVMLEPQLQLFVSIFFA
jgi:hypothetical protein